MSEYIGVRDEEPGEHLPHLPQEISSSKCEIIRALDFGEDLFFFRDHPNPMRKKGNIFVHLEILWYEHSANSIQDIFSH